MKLHHTTWWLGALLITGLGACGPREPGRSADNPAIAAPTAPAATTATPATGPVLPNATSVPDAAAALPTQEAAPGTGSPNSMTKQTESSAMPLPGQANDH